MERRKDLKTLEIMLYMETCNTSCLGSFLCCVSGYIDVDGMITSG